MKNPFPGPQPYRAADRDRFFGRVDMAHKLEGSILANRCVTVYGPSGAGKSSVLQACVFPTLVERHDVRLVRVDAWPAGEEPTAWLASTMRWEIGIADDSAEVTAKDAVFKAAKVAARSSSRLLVIYLDQLEQLLFTGRTFEEIQPFFDCVEELVDLPLRNVRVVLSLREDYLGRFRDRLRDFRRMTENGFRVGPLSVYELTEAVVQAAAAGEPPQTWAVDEVRGLMVQVRVPGQSATDEAEAQSAYAQIICRALFQERAAGKTVDVTEAEPILRNYLASTVDALGPLRNRAQQLLEDHLVGADGSRTLRSEKELGRVIDPPELDTILKQLESAAILRAEERHGSRYFEIGHDWLARRVHEQRAERERSAEQELIEEAQARQLEQARTQQRKLRGIAAAAITIAALVGAAAVVALIARSQAITAQEDAETARKSAEASEQKAAWERDEANDLRVMAGYLALKSQGDGAGAMKLLTEVKKPEERSGWVAYANQAIDKNALFVTLRGHREALRTAVFSDDGKRILSASDDHTARIWNADGTGEPIVLTGHRGAITFAAFSPDSKTEASHVLTTSADGTSRVWTIRGSDVTSIELSGKNTEATYGAWSPDGQRVAVASINVDPTDEKETFVVRVHAASDGSIIGEHAAHQARIHGAVFIDDTHIMTVSEDKTARFWNGVTKGRLVSAPGHAAPVTFVVVNREHGIVVTTSTDSKARVFKVGANEALTPVATLEGHARDVVHADISDDGKFVATASTDRTARVWNIEQPFKKAHEVVLDKHNGSVTFVAFRKGDSQIVATASTDHAGRIFRVDVPDEPFVLTGHTAPLRSIAWRPDGKRLVTAASDSSQSASGDHSAKIWSADSADRRNQSVDGGKTSKGSFHVAAFAGEGQVFAAAYDDGSVLWRDERRASEPLRIEAPATERWGFVSAVVPSPDGARLALASLGADALDTTKPSAQNGLPLPIRALMVYDNATSDKQMLRREVPVAIRHVAWNAAGDRIVAALEDATAIVFRVDRDSPPLVFSGHKAWLTSASFSPDGHKLVTTSFDKTALVFDVNAPAVPIARFEHPAEVYAATFDATGKRMATACADGKVRIFDLASTTPVTQLDAKGIPLHRVVWSEDGTRIAASSPTGSIFVWSPIVLPAAGEILPMALQTEASVAALAFVGGGHRLVGASARRTYAWELDVATLKADLHARNLDCLGVIERILYLNETAIMAAKAFDACESAQHRVRPAEAASPMNAKDLVVTRLLVLPQDAEIEVDGALVGRRDGLLDLWGAPGEKKKLRVVRGTDSIEVEVTMDAMGAHPSVIDLDANRPSKGGAGKASKKLDEGDFDALVPVDFQ